MGCAIGVVTAEQWPLRDSDVPFKGNKNTACPLRLTLCKILFHRVFLTCCKQKANSENQAVHIFIEIRVEICLVFRHTFVVLAKQSRSIFNVLCSKSGFFAALQDERRGMTGSILETD